MNESSKCLTLPVLAPSSQRRVLLHSCCAPCSGAIIEAMHTAMIDFSVFFYNPNIHPRREYELRKSENKRYADLLGVPFIDPVYDCENWFAGTQGLENEPERGIRCNACFDIRLEQTARYAYENGFSIIASTLGLSRWKNQTQVNASGHRAAGKFPGVSYWDYNWRKNGGTERASEIARDHNFYRQEYCGCIYSLRDTNHRRAAAGNEPISSDDAQHVKGPTQPSGG